MTVKIMQVKRNEGEVVLVIQYDHDSTMKTLDLDNKEIILRMKELKKLVGRALTLQDLKDVVVQIVNETRQGKAPLAERFPYETYIGVELEQ